MNSNNKKFIDVLSIGFGPAGLALACVFDEHKTEHHSQWQHHFLALEKADSCAWHPNLLLPGTDINHHVYRDLVTPRNPQSPYSFAMYLKDKNRLFKFGLLGRPASRFEWSDYMIWVAQKMESYVQYRKNVTHISPVINNGLLDGFSVSGENFEYITNKLILSSGSTPFTPKMFDKFLSNHVFHTSAYLEKINNFQSNIPKRWIVIGSGQSAGEVIADLINKKEDIEILSLHRSIGFKIAQLGQFPNLVFLPEKIEYFKSLSPENKKVFFEHIKSTNYSGIDVDESQSLFSIMYEDEVIGKERLRMIVNSEMMTIDHSNGEYQVIIKDIFTGEETTHICDSIVLGTGYYQNPLPDLLAKFDQFLVKDFANGLTIDNDYKVKLKNCGDAHLYVNGLSERTHGISDAQSFSAVAIRAERIYESIKANTKTTDDYAI
ncbi:SidA/IucD/PvdA family monooxygenase [Photorhabdus luminescens]|uniref:L-lysine 6-monooxygenase n=1 Tax=Photorhabdus luminescens subsp. sonorensis TaxID=1173677 RepID=A0A5C4RIC1_PHOLU|nr:SidA/IucD/PvdA family monooxygenase [Photorhabdus luminescens]TNH43575.1 L-lysine 6-monooxygenase [Photorhabdus luminescens subsp. sonorensis]